MKRTSAAFVPSLEAWTYSDPARYRAEVERIFHRSWIFAAHESQLDGPGSYLTLTIGDNPILLARGADGVVRAFFNVCVHRGHVLVEGSGRANVLVCPYHAWSYDSSGRLVRALGLDEATCAGRGLVPVELESWRGFLFVRLVKGEGSLEETYGPAFRELEGYLPQIDRLRYVRRYVHDVDGNWKVLVDNYLECYHCPANHPSFVDLMRAQEYEIRTFAYWSTHRAPPGRPDNTAYPFEGDNGFDGWFLWPNLTFNLFPGGPNLLVFHMHPLTPDTSIGYCDYFFVDGEVGPQEEALMHWETHVLSEEDNERVASVHRGLKSIALREGLLVHAPERGEITEHAIRHFHDLVARAMEGA